MRHILHILTKPADALAQEIIARQSENPELKVKVMDLAASNPDYKMLLEKVFQSDSIETW